MQKQTELFSLPPVSVRRVAPRGIVPISGYLLWTVFVLYIAGGLTWEILAPSTSQVRRTPGRTVLFAGLTLMATAVCLLAPLIWN
jgi:hypothetical protein